MILSSVQDDTSLADLAAGQTVSRGKYKICPFCHNVKYKKQWHAADSKVAHLARGKRAHAERLQCPSCYQRQTGNYDAILRVHDVPPCERGRIEALIVREGRAAMGRNPQQRIHELIATVDGYEVRLSGQKLARAVWQKLHSEHQVID